MAGVNPIPKGSEGVIAHLVVEGAAEAIEFYKKAFGATEVRRSSSPDGKKLMHAELKIGNATIYLCDDFPEFCPEGTSRSPKKLGATSVTLHQYVTDTDAAVKKAEQAGATVTMPPADMFWGDRYGTVRDPFGHDWSFATHVKDMTPEEMEQAAEQAFSGAGAC